LTTLNLVDSEMIAKMPNDSNSARRVSRNQSVQIERPLYGTELGLCYECMSPVVSQNGYWREEQPLGGSEVG